MQAMSAGPVDSKALDWFSHFRYVPLQDAEIRDNFPDLTYDMLMAEMYVVNLCAGKRFGGLPHFAT